MQHTAGEKATTVTTYTLTFRYRASSRAHAAANTDGTSSAGHTSSSLPSTSSASFSWTPSRTTGCKTASPTRQSPLQRKQPNAQPGHHDAVDLMDASQGSSTTTQHDVTASRRHLPPEPPRFQERRCECTVPRRRSRRAGGGGSPPRRRRRRDG